MNYTPYTGWDQLSLQLLRLFSNMLDPWLIDESTMTRASSICSNVISCLPGEPSNSCRVQGGQRNGQTSGWVIHFMRYSTVHSFHKTKKESRTFTSDKPWAFWCNNCPYVSVAPIPNIVLLNKCGFFWLNEWMREWMHAWCNSRNSKMWYIHYLFIHLFFVTNIYQVLIMNQVPC